jgi:hypothetical protein
MGTERVRHWFFSGFSIAAASIVFVGFAPSFYLRSFTDGPPLPPLVVVHSIAFTSWIVLLLAQTTLAATSRIGLHRRLGAAGAVLLAVMIALGWTTAIAAARHGYIPGQRAGMADPLAGLIIPLRDLLLFAAAAAAALYFRRSPETHKRLMIIATINLLPAASGRIFAESFVGLTPVLILACVVAGPIYDRAGGRRLHWAYLWGGSLTFLSLLVQFPIARTAAWHRVAAWLIG